LPSIPDPKSQMKFIEWYEKKTSTISQDARQFHAFERGDYYSFHGADIDVILKTSLKSSIVTKNMKPAENCELRYATLNKSLTQRLIRELLLFYLYRVEVYTIKKDEYTLSYKGSPGNLREFETLLSDASSNDNEVVSNLLVSFQLSPAVKNKIGICSIDSDQMSIELAEFEDSDFFTELESALVILAPREVIVPSTKGDYEKIYEVLSRNKTLRTTTMKKNEFVKTPAFLEELEKIYRFRKGQQRNIHTVPEVKLDLAMGALAAALNFLNIGMDESHMNRFSMKVLNLNRFVHMDLAAFSALNLFPTPGSSSSSIQGAAHKTQSVLGVLDRCKTNQGRRMLRQWIKQPLKQIDTIRARLDVIQSLVDNEEIQSILYKEFLSIIPDVLLLVKKMTRKTGSPQDMFKIHQVLGRVPEIIALLKKLNCNAVNSLLIVPFTDFNACMEKIRTLIENVIDFEALQRGEYLIAANLDQSLFELKQEMDNIEAQMEKDTKAHAKRLGLQETSFLKLDYVSHLGFYLRTTRKEDQNIRKHKEFEIIDTAKNCLRFTTEKLKEMNEKYAIVKVSYEEQQKVLVQTTCATIATYAVPLNNINHLIATLDVFVGLAQVVMNSPGIYVRPEMFPEDQRVLQLQELRHPCLECQEDIEYIPNDVNFKENESELLVVTGANISGKSTYIRSIGIAVKFNF
jgi:DNA mismatch repair protein MSH2